MNQQQQQHESNFFKPFNHSVTTLSIGLGCYQQSGHYSNDTIADYNGSMVSLEVYTHTI